MTSERNNTIKVSLKKDNLFLFANSPEIGEAKEEMDISYKEEEIEIKFNPKYLIDATKNIGEEEIILSFSTPERPLLIESPKRDTVYVIMPKRV
jgi:DNA polymerase-3 subunit beta